MHGPVFATPPLDLRNRGLESYLENLTFYCYERLYEFLWFSGRCCSYLTLIFSRADLYQLSRRILTKLNVSGARKNSRFG